MFFQTKVGKRNLQQQTGNLAQVQLMVFIICFHFRSNTIKAIHEICTYMYINLRKKFEKWAWKKKLQIPSNPLPLTFSTYFLYLYWNIYLPSMNRCGCEPAPLLARLRRQEASKNQDKSCVVKNLENPDKRDWELHGGRLTSWERMHIPFFNHFWKMIVLLFQRWDMLVPWRVLCQRPLDWT